MFFWPRAKSSNKVTNGKKERETLTNKKFKGKTAKCKIQKKVTFKYIIEQDRNYVHKVEGCVIVVFFFSRSVQFDNNKKKCNSLFQCSFIFRPTS